MNQQFFPGNGKLDQGMSAEKFDLIIAAILDGKYSLACIFILRFHGYEPRNYVPYGTYNRLMKEKLKLEKIKPALVKELETITDRCPPPAHEKVNSEIKFSENVEINRKHLSRLTVYQCRCPICQQPGNSLVKQQHTQMNLFLSRLNEQQRRWYVALEAKKLGHGGIKYMSQVTGMHSDTIRRGRKELDNFLAERPVKRVRQVGGGRKTFKKTISV